MSRISKYTIKEPIWDGGTKQRAIGIAEFRLPCLVTIDYEDKHGNKVYPHKYVISKRFARKFPVKVVRNDVKLRIIPVNELENRIKP